jgi:hypothetical protein
MAAEMPPTAWAPMAVNSISGMLSPIRAMASPFFKPQFLQAQPRLADQM